MGKDFGLAVWGYFLEGQAFTLGLEMETDTEVFGGEGRKSENETEPERGETECCQISQEDRDEEQMEGAKT